MKIGFVGMGRMGIGMAANLLRAGHDVAVWNRTPGKTQALLDLGAQGFAQVSEVCRGDAVITMLTNDDATESVAFRTRGIVASLPKGSTHISSSTLSLPLSQRLSAPHAPPAPHFIPPP